MIRRPPRSTRTDTLFSLHDALPISGRRSLHSSPQVAQGDGGDEHGPRSEEHTSELQSLMRISYAVFCLKKKKHFNQHIRITDTLIDNNEHAAQLQEKLCHTNKINPRFYNITIAVAFVTLSLS